MDKQITLNIFGLNLAARYVYVLIAAIICIPADLLGLPHIFSPAVALFTGLVFALVFPMPYPRFNKKASKYLLQASVVGLGFGMNVNESLKSGAEGMMFTIISVFAVMTFGIMFGYWMHINRKTAYLISSGTAICGGSAIAAVGPVVKASDQEMAVSLGVIFMLNAIALFIFPPMGKLFGMSQEQFGTWAAIAIHDTSSVVGAGAAYGQEALKIATLVTLTRALWIIPLALITMVLFRDKTARISIPWFIFMFIGAMLVNTYCNLPAQISEMLVYVAHKGLVLTLFFIGAGLSIKAIKAVGIRPLALAILLWIIIGVSSFFVITTTM